MVDGYQWEAARVERGAGGQAASELHHLGDDHLLLLRRRRHVLPHMHQRWPSESLLRQLDTPTGPHNLRLCCTLSEACTDVGPRTCGIMEPSSAETWSSPSACVPSWPTRVEGVVVVLRLDGARKGVSTLERFLKLPHTDTKSEKVAAGLEVGGRLCGWSPEAECVAGEQAGALALVAGSDLPVGRRQATPGIVLHCTHPHSRQSGWVAASLGETRPARCIVRRVVRRSFEYRRHRRWSLCRPSPC